MESTTFLRHKIGCKECSGEEKYCPRGYFLERKFFRLENYVKGRRRNLPQNDTYNPLEGFAFIPNRWSW